MTTAHEPTVRPARAQRDAAGRRPRPRRSRRRRAGFHARYSAAGKTYEYRIWQRRRCSRRSPGRGAGTCLGRWTSAAMDRAARGCSRDGTTSPAFQSAGGGVTVGGADRDARRASACASRRAEVGARAPAPTRRRRPGQPRSSSSGLRRTASSGTWCARSSGTLVEVGRRAARRGIGRRAAGLAATGPPRARRRRPTASCLVRVIVRRAAARRGSVARREACIMRRLRAPGWHRMALEKLLASIEPGSPEDALARRVDPARLPAHIAIIMDGNGRWAAQRHLPRVERPPGRASTRCATPSRSSARLGHPAS
ncbi:MAG: hypothetical protein MZU84_04360 [Sphingobacterium sp.]|nr:hypothetical protein [Sphingobacterium sp.]